MKDARHHLKHLQKKVMRLAKKENKANKYPLTTEDFHENRRPKIILNKKKAA